MRSKYGRMRQDVPPQAATNKRLAIRFAIGLFIIALLILGYQWIRGVGDDLTGRFGGAKDTKGWIAAIELRGDKGHQVVAFKPDGAKVASPDFREGAEDQGIAWRPDGKFLFFSSDRTVATLDIYRWEPEANRVDRVSYGSRGKTNLAFGPPGYTKGNDTALMTAGGFVLEYDSKDKSTRQLLPPAAGEPAVGGSEGGVGTQFDRLYERLGKSFREAKWTRNRRHIVATMIRESGEQVLVLQGMNPVKAADGSERFPPPVAVAAGERIEFDVAADGKVVFTTQGFEFPDPQAIPPEFIVNGAVKPPYRHAISFFDPDDPSKGVRNLGISPDDGTCFGQPRISPDSSAVLFLAGMLLESGEFAPQGLVLAPVEDRGVEKARPVTRGDVREPDWSPDASLIAFVKRGPKGNRAIFTVRPDGEGEKEVSGGNGDYAWPKFSPMK